MGHCKATVHSSCCYPVKGCDACWYEQHFECRLSASFLCSETVSLSTVAQKATDSKLWLQTDPEEDQV